MGGRGEGECGLGLSGAVGEVVTEWSLSSRMAWSAICSVARGLRVVKSMFGALSSCLFMGKGVEAGVCVSVPSVGWVLVVCPPMRVPISTGVGSGGSVGAGTDGCTLMASLLTGTLIGAGLGAGVSVVVGTGVWVLVSCPPSFLFSPGFAVPPSFVPFPRGWTIGPFPAFPPAPLLVPFFPTGDFPLPDIWESIHPLSSTKVGGGGGVSQGIWGCMASGCGLGTLHSLVCSPLLHSQGLTYFPVCVWAWLYPAAHHLPLDFP